MRNAIVERKKTFYWENVSNLLDSNPCKWWNCINKLTGISNGTIAPCCEDETGNIISGTSLVVRLNQYYVSVASDIPLWITPLYQQFCLHSMKYRLEHLRYAKKFYKINPLKVISPDDIPNRIWKEFVPELAVHVTEIFNASFSSGLFPKLWKALYVSPIPKITPVYMR